MNLFRLSILAFLFPISLMAQSFEGKIDYSISYKKLPPEMQQAEGMLPKSQSIWVKGDKSRFEQIMEQGGTVVISDAAEGTSTILMDMMGQKYRMDIPKKEMDEMIKGQSVPEISYVEGTKEIARYTCKKAEVMMDGFDGKAIFYYTEEIPPVQVKGMEALSLKGMFMAYEASTQGMTIIIEVTNLVKTPVSDDKFIVPAGYTEIPEQLKSMMGIK